MSDDAPVRCWLVERDYTDRGLIRLVYATPEGERALQREQSATVMNQRGGAVTAAIEADPDALEPVSDAELVERYALEATRMAERHEPDDEV